MHEIERLRLKRKACRHVAADQVKATLSCRLVRNKVEADNQSLRKLGGRVNTPLPAAGTDVDDALRALDRREKVDTQGFAKCEVLKIQPVDLTRMSGKQVTHATLVPRSGQYPPNALRRAGAAGAHLPSRPRGRSVSSSGPAASGRVRRFRVRRGVRCANRAAAQDSLQGVAVGSGRRPDDRAVGTNRIVRPGQIRDVSLPGHEALARALSNWNSGDVRADAKSRRTGDVGHDRSHTERHAQHWPGLG